MKHFTKPLLILISSTLLSTSTMVLAQSNPFAASQDTRVEEQRRAQEAARRAAAEEASRKTAEEKAEAERTAQELLIAQEKARKAFEEEINRKRTEEQRAAEERKKAEEAASLAKQAADLAEKQKLAAEQAAKEKNNADTAKAQAAAAAAAAEARRQEALALEAAAKAAAEALAAENARQGAGFTPPQNTPDANSKWDFIYVPSYGNSVIIGPNGEVGCASYNGRDCLWGSQIQPEALDKSKLKPLWCGADHNTKHPYHADGYSIQGHWCNQSFNNFSVPKLKAQGIKALEVAKAKLDALAKSAAAAATDAAAADAAAKQAAADANRAETAAKAADAFAYAISPPGLFEAAKKNGQVNTLVTRNGAWKNSFVLPTPTNPSQGFFQINCGSEWACNINPQGTNLKENLKMKGGNGLANSGSTAKFIYNFQSKLWEVVKYDPVGRK